MSRKLRPRPSTPKRFDHDADPIKLYRIFSNGGNWKVAEKEIGLSDTRLIALANKHPLIHNAVEMGKLDYVARIKVERAKVKAAEENGITTFILDRLPNELKGVWNEILRIEKETEDPELLIDAMTRDLGRRAKQQLFIQSLIYNIYSLSKALKQVGIDRTQYNFWLTQDRDFAKLVQEVQQHKKDYVEHSLMTQIALGNPQAVIFANRTLNRDRGYNEKLEVDVNMQGSMTVDVQLEDLELSLECRKEILAAMQKREQRQQGIVEGAYKRLTGPDDDDEPFFEE